MGSGEEFGVRRVGALRIDDGSWTYARLESEISFNWVFQKNVAILQLHLRKLKRFQESFDITIQESSFQNVPTK